MQHGSAFGLVLGFVFGFPLQLGLWGLARRSPAPSGQPPRWDWRLLAQSSLLYALAFNLTFFIQELFLVVPKALTPGLRPTLYHNNHNWKGSHPLESLFQGTGALAILLSGLICAWLVSRGVGRTPGRRLFLIWMAFNGLFQALPQVVIGALIPENDVGMAMDWFAMSGAAKAVAAVFGLAAIAGAGLWLTRPLLETADDPVRLAAPGRRSAYMLNVATIPAFLAIALIIPFRVPREAMEVLSPPIAVTVVGMVWVQAHAWRVAHAQARGPAGSRSLLVPALLLFTLLAVFQLVLRPGIPFY